MQVTLASPTNSFEQPSLQFEKVTFAYRRKAVFDGFTAGFGHRSLLLGPNGAGKSTLLQLAAGVLKQQEGAIRVGAGGPSSALGRSVGYMPQHIGVVRGMTALEQVTYAAWLRGLKVREAARDAARVLELVDLREKASRPAVTLSGGERRRLGLAEALTGSCELLVLDEPTAGLDPEQRAHFRDVVAGLDQHVVMSTHLVAEVSDDFDDVCVIKGGAALWSGETSAFRRLGDGDLESSYLQVVQSHPSGAA